MDTDRLDEATLERMLEKVRDPRFSLKPTHIVFPSARTARQAQRRLAKIGVFVDVESVAS